MKELINKYNIENSFFYNYFVCNAENRLGVDVGRFLLFQEGSFIHPKKQKQYIDQYIREEIENFYTHNLLHIHQIHFCITTRCTLKCTHCNSLMQYFDEKTHKVDSFQDFKFSINNLIDAVDRIRMFNFIGGEAILNTCLPQMIEYAAEIDKIDYINILTNGTVLFSDELLAALRKYNKRIVIKFSDYSQNDELSGIVCFSKIIKTLNENNIKWQIRQGKTWYNDLGFSLEKDNCIQTTVDKFISCRFKRCFQVLDGVLSHCVKTSAAKALCFEHCIDDDYIFLSSGNNKEIRNSIINLYKKYFLHLCKYCSISNEKIIPAEQIRSRKNIQLGHVIPS